MAAQGSLAMTSCGINGKDKTISLSWKFVVRRHLLIAISVISVSSVAKKRAARILTSCTNTFPSGRCRRKIKEGSGGSWEPAAHLRGVSETQFRDSKSQEGTVERHLAKPSGLRSSGFYRLRVWGSIWAWAAFHLHFEMKAGPEPHG